MELESNRQKLRAQGIGVAALSYDSVEVLKDFSTRRKIGYPLMSDPESKVIRAFGILNEKAPNGLLRGTPHPGTFIVDRKGIVISKYFEEDYTQRYTTSDILVKEFKLAGAVHTTKETRHLRVSSSASSETVHSGQRIVFALDVDLKNSAGPGGSGTQGNGTKGTGTKGTGTKGKTHVYAPGVDGYIPIDFTLEDGAGKVHAAAYPKPKKLRLKAIKETALVYEGSFRILRELTIASDAKLKPLLNAEDEFVVKGSLRYQACDDKVCYPPESIPLEWKLTLESHDRERVPKELQRKP